MGKKHASSSYVSKSKQRRMISHTSQTINSRVVQQSIIAIDTCAFIDIVKVDENYLAKKSEQGYHQILRDIKRLVLKGRLKLVITPTVLTEICEKINAKEFDFITQYCYRVPSLDFEEISLLNKTRARNYIEKNYVRSRRKSNSYMDATILAEACSVGLCLLTENINDMINYGNIYTSGAKIPGGRARAIAEYNREQGIGLYSEYTPRPISPNNFIENFKEGYYDIDIDLEPITENMISLSISE